MKVTHVVFGFILGLLHASSTSGVPGARIDKLAGRTISQILESLRAFLPDEKLFPPTFKGPKPQNKEVTVLQEETKS